MRCIQGSSFVDSADLPVHLPFNLPPWTMGQWGTMAITRMQCRSRMSRSPCRHAASRLPPNPASLPHVPHTCLRYNSHTSARLTLRTNTPHPCFTAASTMLTRPLRDRSDRQTICPRMPPRRASHNRDMHQAQQHESRLHPIHTRHPANTINVAFPDLPLRRPDSSKGSLRSFFAFAWASHCSAWAASLLPRYQSHNLPARESRPARPTRRSHRPQRLPMLASNGVDHRAPQPLFASNILAPGYLRHQLPLSLLLRCSLPIRSRQTNLPRLGVHNQTRQPQARWSQPNYRHVSHSSQAF